MRKKFGVKGVTYESFTFFSYLGYNLRIIMIDCIESCEVVRGQSLRSVFCHVDVVFVEICFRGPFHIFR
jgi:hypothetical protein